MRALPQYQRDLSPANKFTYFFTNELGGRCYISGFNEEGLQVTAAGITDLLTGETIAAGDIGGDRDGSGVDVFNDVLISGVLEANTIKSSQVALVKWLNDGSVPPSVFDKDADPSPVSEGKGFAYIAQRNTLPTCRTMWMASQNTLTLIGSTKTATAGLALTLSPLTT